MATKYRLIIEFRTPEDALEFFDDILAPSMPERADAFEADALDLEGRASLGMYVVKSARERPAEHSLRHLVAKREEAAAKGGEEARNKVKKAR